MGIVIDSSVWIDFFRPKTEHAWKRYLANFFDRTDLVLLEPIAFELLRAAPKHERQRIEAYFATIPFASTPHSLWKESAKLGQRCLDHGYALRSMDLLIAQGCIHNKLSLVTQDRDFLHIAACSRLDVEMLDRGTMV